IRATGYKLNASRRSAGRARSARARIFRSWRRRPAGPRQRAARDRAWRARRRAAGEDRAAFPGRRDAARRAALRRAFLETLRDPLLLRDVERAKLDLEPLSGEDLQAAVASSGKFSPELIARAQRIAETR